jgi:hypothetical protein
VPEPTGLFLAIFSLLFFSTAVQRRFRHASH